MRRLSILSSLLFHLLVQAQFDGPGGEQGSKSILKDASCITGWATGAQLDRGYRQINDKPLGLSTIGNESSAAGKADGDVVSLGDSGIVTLTFDHPILDRNGYDFAVFENGFKVGVSYYLELAHVEVSKNGLDFVRFPSESLTDTIFQTNNFSYTDPYKIYNLAGKHQAPYGTLFDINELGFDTVNFVRLIDVVGSVNDTFGSRDSKGRLINDPFPSPYESSGFDLDAVAIVNGELLSVQENLTENSKIYPTYVFRNQPIHVDVPGEVEIVVTDIHQRRINSVVNDHTIRIPTSGIYLIHIEDAGKKITQKVCVN